MTYIKKKIFYSALIWVVSFLVMRPPTNCKMNAQITLSTLKKNVILRALAKANYVISIGALVVVGIVFSLGFLYALATFGEENDTQENIWVVIGLAVYTISATFWVIYLSWHRRFLL